MNRLTSYPNSGNLFFSYGFTITGGGILAPVLFIVSIFLSVFLAKEKSLEEKSIMRNIMTLLGFLIAVADLCFILFVIILYSVII